MSRLKRHVNNISNYWKKRKHSFGWYQPFACSAAHGSKIKNFPTYQKRLSCLSPKDHFQNRKEREREKSYYDQHSDKELPPLIHRNKVSMHHENEWIQATVVNKHHTPWSYIVQTLNGKFYQRNRRHLRKGASQAKNKETDYSDWYPKQTSYTRSNYRSRSTSRNSYPVRSGGQATQIPERL